MTLLTPAAPGRALPWWQRKSGRRHLQRVVVTVLLWLVLILVMVPFLWMLSTALKDEGAVFFQPPEWVPAPLRWDNFYQAVTQIPFFTFFQNSVLITSLAVVGTLLSSSLAAFAFARLRAPARGFLFIVLLCTLMLPGEVTLVSTYLLFKSLGWLNTYLPLIVPAFFGAPFYIFLLRQFFMTLPVELDEAARIDGAGYLRIYRQLVLPLSKPALTTVAVFTFFANWSDFLGPLIYLNNIDRYTLAVGLNYFIGQYSGQTPWNWFMAASLLAMLPCLLVFLVAQRWFIQGAVLTGIKG
jgi:ABC-type glycerol-3-phosphate transport system permease component